MTRKKVLWHWHQVDRLHVAEVDVMAQQEDEEELADILLLLVPIQSLVPLELGPENIKTLVLFRQFESVLVFSTLRFDKWSEIEVKKYMEKEADNGPNL